MEKLKSEWEKDKEGAIALMAITYDHRCKWITEEVDSIHSVLRQFLYLKPYDFVSYCYTDVLMHRYTICSFVPLNCRFFGSLKSCRVTKSVI